MQIHDVPDPSIGQGNDNWKCLVGLQAHMADDALVQDGVDGLAVVGGAVGIAMQPGALGCRFAHDGGLAFSGGPQAHAVVADHWTPRAIMTRAS